MANSTLIYTGLLAVLLIWTVNAQSMDQLIMMSQASSDDAGMLVDRDTVMVELDMLFTPEDYKLMYEMDHTNENNTDSRRNKRKAINFDRYRWTNAEIPYVINNPSFSSKQLAEVQAAITTWSTYTCLRFRPVRSGDNNYIRYQNGRGCSSFVGMIGGEQPINLAPGCRYRGVIMHEMGHALGFHHEQTRPDRDSYVRVIDRNINPSMRYNFQKHSREVINSRRVSYDYRSIMHYGKTAFTTNGGITIQTLDPAFTDVIGGRSMLSFKDVKLANIIYKCAARCRRKTCPGDGFVGKDCQCWCSSDADDTPAIRCSDRGTGGNKGGTGGGNKGGTGGNTGGGAVVCRDNLGICVSFAAKVNGDCQRTAIGMPVKEWMFFHCKKSCKLCNTGGRKEVCKDDDANCASWATQGECKKNPTWMLDNCKKSCKRCSTEGKTVTVGGPVAGVPCVFPFTYKGTVYNHCTEVDYNQGHWCATTDDYPKDREWGKCPVAATCNDDHLNCVSWAAKGECSNNPGWMHVNCKKSCNTCASASDEVSCANHNTNCEYWGRLGYCTHQSLMRYMKEICPAVCNVCSSTSTQTAPVCSDTNEHCPYWASTGECESNAGYMDTACQKSCQKC